MTALAKKAKEMTEVARPLHVLVPLIKDDLKKGDEAGMQHYVSAGQKLNEAQEGSFSDRPVSEFWDWAARNFKRQKAQLGTYMRMATAAHKKSFSKIKSVAGFKRSVGQSSQRETGRVFREYQQPVDAISERAQVTQIRLAREELDRAEEREAQRKLAIQLIDIGWKVLAAKFHPDKMGGSRDAMVRLNTVRDRLKACA